MIPGMPASRASRRARRSLLAGCAAVLALSASAPAAGTPAPVVVKDPKDALGADGVNLLNSCGSAAWQSVFHFHVHVIPRYRDDPLRLPWVPGPGDAEEIAAAAAALRA